MIIVRGTEPTRWEKTYYSDDIDKVKEQHHELYPEYIIEEIEQC